MKLFIGLAAFAISMYIVLFRADLYDVGAFLGGFASAYFVMYIRESMK